MNIEEAVRARATRIRFKLLEHADPEYASKQCHGEGRIESLGATEAQLVCLACETRFIASIAVLPEISDMRFAAEYKDLMD